MKQLIFPVKEQYEEYVIDEAKYTGYAQSISFPESEEEIQKIFTELAEAQIPITIQGGKTGITGASIPKGGHILNLSHMNKVKGSKYLEDGTGRIIVEPGINLIDLKKEIGSIFRKTPLFWPPDPTEDSATVGGVAATNAQGISRLLYGDSQAYILALRLIDGKGNIHVIKRGDTINLSSGQTIEMMDAVLGKEGITGVISELTLKLIPKPASVWGIAFFFDQSESVGKFIDMLKQELPFSEKASVAAVEYIDRQSIDLIEIHKNTMTKIKELPDVNEDTKGMVYIELHGEEESIEVLAEKLMEKVMLCGGDPDEAWAVSGESDVDKLHAFRHSAAETTNLYIEGIRRQDNRITKLGTDMMVFNVSFSKHLKEVQEGLKTSGLKGCIFGHALKNHLHVNILPETYAEYEIGIHLIQKWSALVYKKSGKVIGEHGIGKLKREIQEDFIPPEYTALCRELKRYFDEENIWNKGNIIAGIEQEGER